MIRRGVGEDVGSEVTDEFEALLLRLLRSLLTEAASLSLEDFGRRKQDMEMSSAQLKSNYTSDYASKKEGRKRSGKTMYCIRYQ